MRIFVTGANGFVGAHFVELALARGHHITGTYSSDAADRQPLLQSLRSRGAILHKVDIQHGEELRQAMQGAECVCHFAAAFRESGVDEAYFDRINVGGTRNALEAAQATGVRRFVFCSTAGIHGQRVAYLIDETSPLQPFNAYERSKVAAEALVREFCAAHGMEWVIIRPTAIYGPRDQRLFKLFSSAARGRFPLFGRGEGRRHMVYVADLAELFLQACTNPAAANEAFIGGGPAAVRLRDMLGTLAAAIGRSSTGPSLPLAPMLLLAGITEDVCGKLHVKPPLYRRRMDFYLNDAAFDCSKAADRLGWRPAVDLPQGLRATFAAYRAAKQL